MVEKIRRKVQGVAWWAAWMGWTLDSFDFTVFPLIMVPISKEFDVPLTEVTAVFAITLWLRLVGATASGWLADRVGRFIIAILLGPETKGKVMVSNIEVFAHEASP